MIQRRLFRVVTSLLLYFAGLSSVCQQNPSTKDESAKTGPSSQPGIDYVQEAAGSSVFIYAGDSKPCEDPPQGQQPLTPAGSGFFVGLRDASVPVTPGKVVAWRFLVTAGHVLKERNSIVIRLNRASPASGFVCFPVILVRDGQSKTVYTLKGEDAADVVAVEIPALPEADPVTFSASMLMDPEAMKKNDVKVGTNVFTVGYFLGYAGQKQNYPITKFGKISILTPERWYFNPDWQRNEEAYVVEMQNTPGLSGAPVITYGVEFHVSPFQYRELGPNVVGLVKGLTLAPVPVGQGNAVLIPQGAAGVEPAAHIKKLFQTIAAEYRKRGAQVAQD